MFYYIMFCSLNIKIGFMRKSLSKYRELLRFKCRV